MIVRAFVDELLQAAELVPIVALGLAAMCAFGPHSPATSTRRWWQ